MIVFFKINDITYYAVAMSKKLNSIDFDKLKKQTHYA